MINWAEKQGNILFLVMLVFEFYFIFIDFRDVSAKNGRYLPTVLKFNSQSYCCLKGTPFFMLK